MQFEAIIDRRCIRLAGKPEIEQGLVQQYAREIAGKRPARRVRTMHPRGQADNQQACIIVAKRRNRSGMVIGVTLRHLVEETSQPRATPAFDGKFLLANGA